MNLRCNTMNFLVLYHEQLPWYTTKFRGTIPCFFSPCTNILRAQVNDIGIDDLKQVT